jgi:signal transduction histidine kinase/CheY-like chemotaxis protein
VKSRNITREKIPSVKTIAFILAFFLFAVIGGGTVFFSVISVSVHNTAEQGLVSLAKLERTAISGEINKQIALASQMSNSAVIQAFLRNPNDEALKKQAYAELESYAESFGSQNIFWVSNALNDEGGHDYYFGFEYLYSLSEDDPEEEWYLNSKNAAEPYNFNIDTNSKSGTRLWINAKAMDDGEFLGIVGIGVDITEFFDIVYRNVDSKQYDLYFFNAEGQITGAEQVALAEAKYPLAEHLNAGRQLIDASKNLAPGEAVVIRDGNHEIGLINVEAIGWSMAIDEEITILSYLTNSNTHLYLIVILAVALVVSSTFSFAVMSARSKNKAVAVGKELEQINATLEERILARTSELEEQTRLAIAANSSKSAFLATMSHEIRTPMNAILGISQIQLMKPDLPADVAEALGKIQISGSVLLRIINDILDFSKIERGKLEINPTDYDLPSLINDAVQLNILRIQSKPIEFTLDVDPKLPAKLRGDELRLKQILSNILSNSFKYTDEGSVALGVSCERDGDSVRLTFRVADTGQGMTEEHLQKLFDEYSRFNESANRTTEGTGLGMNITNRLVKLMGGQISVESALGKGSTFTVVIPQGYLNDTVIGAELAEKLRKFEFVAAREQYSKDVVYTNMSYGRVLIVDDVETNLYVAGGFMSPYKLSVETASSGFEALEKIENGAVYDVIFMDHMMPKMDGIETTAKIRAAGYSAPIVTLTANAIVGNEQMFKENGFDAFISKPIDIMQLNAVLNKFVRDKHKSEAVIETADELPASRINYNARLMKFFRRDAAKAIVTLSETAESDLPLFSTTAHAMKSACANVGCKEASELAKELEFAGKNGDMEFIRANASKLVEKLREIVGDGTESQSKEAAFSAGQHSRPASKRSLREGISAEKTLSTDDVIEDTKLLSEKLRIIKQAAEDYDHDTANIAIAELRKSAWKSETLELLDTLETYLLHSDFDEAAEAITRKGGIL